MKAFLEEWAVSAKEVERALSELWLDTNQDLKDLVPNYRGALEYATLSGGKRFRPVLCLKAAEALGVSANKAMPFGLSLELIHCFSLAHDDLPCMDDDDYRRGVPSLHKKFNEATALLAGDGLIFEAIDLLVVHYKDDPDLALQLVACLSKAAGSRGMIAGQILDLIAQSHKQSLKDLERVHRLKTGALIRSAVEAACILSSLEKEKTKSMLAFAEALGLAFQVKDDLLELEEGKLELGSYPSVMGEEESKNFLLELNQQCERHLEFLGDRAHFLENMIQYNFQRNQ